MGEVFQSPWYYFIWPQHIANTLFIIHILYHDCDPFSVNPVPTAFSTQAYESPSTRNKPPPKMSTVGGRSGRNGGHHCIAGCHSRSTQVCIRKGHQAWCILCGNLVKLHHGCTQCQVKDPKYFSDKQPKVELSKREQADALKMQNKEADSLKIQLLKRNHTLKGKKGGK